MTSGKEMTDLFPDPALKWRLAGAKLVWGQSKWDGTTWFLLSLSLEVLEKGVWWFVLLPPVVTQVQVGKVVLCHLCEVTLRWVSGGGGGGFCSSQPLFLPVFWRKDLHSMPQVSEPLIYQLQTPNKQEPPEILDRKLEIQTFWSNRLKWF